MSRWHTAFALDPPASLIRVCRRAHCGFASRGQREGMKPEPDDDLCIMHAIENQRARELAVPELANYRRANSKGGGKAPAGGNS